MDLVIVKNTDGKPWHRAWLSPPDRDAVSIEVSPHDFAHLVAESYLGLEFGFWGLLSLGAFPNSRRLAGVRNRRRARQSKTTPIYDHVTRDHKESLAVAEFVGNELARRDHDADAIRDSLLTKPSAERHAVAARLDDNVLELMRLVLHRLLDEWSAVEPGECLRLTWPLQGATRPATPAAG